MNYHPENIVNIKTQLGESPSWDAEQQKLLWVDILAPSVLVYDPENKTNSRYDLNALGQFCGCIAPFSEQKCVVALDRKMALLDFETIEIDILTEVDPAQNHYRFNDGKCDPAGRFLASTMQIDGQGTKGNLYALQSDWKSPHILRQHLKIGNGIAWSPDHSTFYLADSKERNILAFDYELETGRITNPRTAFRIPNGVFVADGMTTDQEGMIWLALWDGFRITRWNPKTGMMIEFIDLPAPRVTSCTFGGTDMDELYITTARTGLDEATLNKYPESGSLFRVKTQTKGMPSFRFKKTTGAVI
jgi:sugar lactone lactonase YvrE